MPGNEVGDRIHNFFGQETSSQGQHHSQIVDGTWQGFSNNAWVGSQRQIGSPLISNLKNLNVPQTADAERGQSSSVQHGVNYTQSALRSELFRSQPQIHQQAVNGYIQGNQVQIRKNEANLLGVDTESDRHSLASRGMSVIDQQLGNGPDVHKKNSMRLESTESPVNYDFFGGQQQMIGQHSMLQPLPRQAPGVSDMLLHQQIMLKQMQEFQRQQQLQRHQLPQQEARQVNSINQVASMTRQTTGNPSAGLINGIPVHDTANYSWQPELVAANANWLQRGASPVVQGSSSGFVFTPEQGQIRLMGLVQQPFEQSLYGVPVTSTRGSPSQYPSVQMDKAAMLQLSGGNNSFPAEHYPAFPDQVTMQSNNLLPRQGSLGKSTFGPAAIGGSNGGLGSENFQQFSPQQRTTSVQEFNSRQDVVLPSETSEDKTSTQVTPSHNVATLDPTEERILFGSDDNLWDAFGRGSNVSSMLDGSDCLGVFPSVQSGSWSALMQSAVAETSGGDIGPPEEWNGLNVQNTTGPSGNQLPSVFVDGGKQQSTWAGYNLQCGSTVNSSSPFSPTGNTTAGVNYCSIPTASQSGTKVSHEQNERLQPDPPQGLGQQFSDEGSKWLDHNSLQKPVTEGSQLHRNVSHSSSAELSTKGVSWSNQQGVSSYGSGAQAGTRLNGWNFFESTTSGGGAVLQNLGNDGPLQSSQGGEYNTRMPEGMGQGAGIRMADSLCNATVGIGHLGSTMGSRENERDVSYVNNAAAVTMSSNVRANHETSQQLLNNNNLNFFKNVNTSTSSKGSGLPGTYQQHLGRTKTFESLGHNGLDKGVVNAHEMENSIKEISEGFRPNASQHASTIGHNENVWVDANESRTLPGGKQMPSGHVGREPSIARKFQYHPMGNLDCEEEPSYGTKKAAHSQLLSQQQASRGDQGYFGKPKSLTHMSRNSMEIEKDHLSAPQGDSKGMDEVPSKSLHPGYMSNTSTSFDRSVSSYVPDKTTPLSQNMLELLNKVDRSREHGAPTHLSSSDRNRSSEMPDAETSDGSVGHLQQNQSSGSQGFGLQLGPPSQRLSFPDPTLSSQSFSQAVNCLASTRGTSDTAGQSHSWLAPMSSTQSLRPSHEQSEGTFTNSVPSISGKTSDNASLSKMQGNSSTSFSAFSYMRNHLQSQHVTGPGTETSSARAVNLPFDRLVPQIKQIDDSGDRTKKSQLECVSLPEMSKCDLVSSADTSGPNTSTPSHAGDPVQRLPALEAMPAAQPSVSSNTSQQEGVFSKVLPDAWASVSNQQRPLGAQLCKPYSNSLTPQFQSSNNLETSFSDQQKLDENSQKGVEDLSEVGVSLGKSQGLDEKEQPAKEQQLLPGKNSAGPNTMSASHMEGKETYADYSSDTSSSIPTTSQRDIEAFGRSLRPNNTLNDNYSLLHQVLARRSAEIDPSNRSLKRFKGQEDGMESQQVASRGQPLSSINHTSVASRDSKMLNFPSKTRDEHDANVFVHDMVGDSQSQSRDSTAAAVRGDHSYISPHMAPSWFGHYGTFKNGQMLPIYDTQNRGSDSFHVRHPMERVHTFDSSQVGDIRQTTSSSPFSSSQLLPPHTNQNLAIVRPKRKSNNFELVSWGKEVTQGSPRLQNISVAEVGWCRAATRLAEKLEDEAEVFEDCSALFRSKRRLILTTQLMQQLFHPPPASVLSLDATPHYETVAYFIARAALGDACSTLSSSGSDNIVSPDNENLPSDKAKISERIDDPFILKAMEDFINRAKKLENDLLRVDKRASILDLRVEWQELEKFSVINRFAKFHGRGQTDGVETSSSSAAANAQKSSPQRYVTAFPMPRNLPDRVQCLSL